MCPPRRRLQNQPATWTTNQARVSPPAKRSLASTPPIIDIVCLPSGLPPHRYRTVSTACAIVCPISPQLFSAQTQFAWQCTYFYDHRSQIDEDNHGGSTAVFICAWYNCAMPPRLFVGYCAGSKTTRPKLHATIEGSLPPGCSEDKTWVPSYANKKQLASGIDRRPKRRCRTGRRSDQRRRRCRSTISARAKTYKIPR